MALRSNRFPAIIAEIDDAVDEAVRDAANAIARDAQSRAPKLSGDLQDSIHVEKIADGEWVVLAGDGDVFYGHMVEFGTSHSSAQPFLIPAFEANRDNVAREISAALARAGKARGR